MKPFLVLLLLSLLAGCTGGGGYSAEPWSRHYAPPEERDRAARTAQFDVPAPFRGEPASESNRHQREQGNVLGW